jgi:hypothetical protein
MRRFPLALVIVLLFSSVGGSAWGTGYAITDLGNLGGSNVSNVSGTANVGGSQVVVGTAASTAWYWENGTMTSLASALTTLASSNGYVYSSSYATGVNASGQIVGYYTDNQSSIYGFALTVNGSGTVSNVRNVLPISGGYFQYCGNPNVNSVNASGQIPGGCMQGISPVMLTVIANANGTSPATLISSTGYSLGAGINDNGWTTAHDGPDGMVWNGSTWIDIGGLYTFGAYGYGVDAAGDVVGLSGVAGGSALRGHPFYSHYNGTGFDPMVDLGSLSSYYSTYTWGYANAIRNGQVVGYCHTGTRSLPTEYAFSSGTTSGSMVPLQTLVPGFATSNFGSGRLSVADDIDPAGRIVGVGITNSGVYDAYLLTPLLLPGDATGDGAVNVDDLSRVLANYDKGGMTWSQGDFTGDATVDVSDLSILLSHYDQTMSASAGLKAVPEPSGVVLVGIASLALLGLRRRK